MNLSDIASALVIVVKQGILDANDARNIFVEFVEIYKQSLLKEE